MKRIIICLSALLWGIAAFAQTPQEIIARMDAEIGKREHEGIVMSADSKIPILGSVTVKTYTLGNKMRAETTIKGIKVITWTDDTTSWEYDSKKNEITIKKEIATVDAEDDMGMFAGITEGYDITQQSETADAWHFLCKKSKSNTEKDAPKSMDLVVAKGNYLPISLSFKMSGISMTLRNIAFGVTEKQVTFNPADYPDAKIIDKR